MFVSSRSINHVLFFYELAARTMHESFRIGKAATMEVGSVAAGLSPPFAGTFLTAMTAYGKEERF